MDIGKKRARVPWKPTFEKQTISIEKINEIGNILKLCDNDCVYRIHQLQYKINVVENNLHIVPTLKDGLDNMKNELNAVHLRQNQINNALEKICLNIPHSK